MQLPDFTNPTTFPTFGTCPEEPSPPPSPPSSPPDPPTHFLLGQITSNMTISRPTLLLTDRAGTAFALTFDGGGAVDLAARGLRPGCTAVVPGARRRLPTREGGQGFVAVGEGMADAVRALPGGLERVLEVGGRMRTEEAEGRCAGCGRAEEGEGVTLRKCARCGGVRYCGKDCQTTDWGEGHKTDCRLMKAIREAWP